jgi:hypothetical protein
MSAGHRTIDRIQHAQRADRGIRQIDEEHARAIVRLRHDDADPGAFGSGDELLSPVDDPVIAIQVHVVCIIDGSDPCTARVRRLGHEERRTRLPDTKGLQEARLLLGASDLAEQIHIALIGRHRVAGKRPQW